MRRQLLEALSGFRVVRWAVGVALLGRGAFLMLARREYRAIGDFCWVLRVSGSRSLRCIARPVVFATIRRIVRTGRNTLVDSYLADRASAECGALYSLSGAGSHDLFRDLIVLKTATAVEKGVILLKYARTFDAVVSLFDLSRLMARYTFVLEPCWAGYCDPSILMFLAPGHPVIIQCFTQEDYDFIATVGWPFVPLRLGPADWVDGNTFRPADGEEKRYDLVMVANWARHKRHAQLFRALSRIDDRDLRVLLVGFPWSGRTATDIRREAAALAGRRVQVDILEWIPQAQLARHLSQCKVFVFLSRKEGDNKALVEAMFSNVPAIVYRDSVGGATTRINRATGILSSDADLPRSIIYMLDHYREFTPRAWALEHTGSGVATRILSVAIRQALANACEESDGAVVEKTNSPNLAYREADCATQFGADREFVLSCRRGQPA